MAEFNNSCDRQFLENCLKLDITISKDIDKIISKVLPVPKYKLFQRVKVYWSDEEMGEYHNTGIIVGYQWNPANWNGANGFIYTVNLSDGFQEQFPVDDLFDL